MAIKRNKRIQAEVFTSAMSDIMFFLLLFFLIVSTLANTTNLALPKTGNQGSSDKKFNSLTFESENECEFRTVNGKAIKIKLSGLSNQASDSLNIRSDQAKIEDVLKKNLPQNPKNEDEKTVMVNISRYAKVQTLVNALYAGDILGVNWLLHTRER